MSRMRQVTARYTQIGLGRILILGWLVMAGPGRADGTQPASAPVDASGVESRGVWIDKAQLLDGREDVLTRLDRLAAAGFNTVYIAVQVRGTVLYPDSAVLPHYAEAARREPQLLDWLLPAARERGLRAEAWAEFGYYAYWTPDASRDASRGAVLDRDPTLAAVARDGGPLIHNEKWGDFYALCPANPAAQDVLIRLYVEMLTRYRFDGLQLDRIRFPDLRFCHCAWCREHFAWDTGLALADVREGTPAWSTWLDWRKEQVNRGVSRLARAIRRNFPAERLTAAVVPPEMIDEKGQDWPVWLREGWVDAVAPMLYRADISADAEWIRRHVPRPQAVFPGLDVEPGGATLVRNIEVARKAGFGGVTIWHAGPVEPLLEDLRRSAFAGPASAP